MDIWAKIRAQITWRKLPGHAVWILGLGREVLGTGWKLLDVGGRLDMFQRIVVEMGGTAGMMASLVLSPWTSIA